MCGNQPLKQQFESPVMQDYVHADHDGYLYSKLLTHVYNIGEYRNTAIHNL